MQKYDTVMLSTAHNFAQQSYCNRLKVGAVLSVEGRILATGYNGTIRGMDNCCEGPDGKTSDFTLHAEQNIITFCARKGIPTESTTLYITHSPCKQCAKLIAQSGITEVVYSTDYRDSDGLNFLTSCGVLVRKASHESS